MRNTLIIGGKLSELTGHFNQDPIINIFVPADYPTIIEANDNPRTKYILAADATDNVSAKTNTGFIGIKGMVILWNGINNYTIIDQTFWKSGSGALSMITPEDLDVQNKDITNTKKVIFKLDDNVTLEEGELGYFDGALSIGRSNGVKGQLCEEDWLAGKPKNDEATLPIPNGTPVYASGALGSNLLIKIADAANFSGACSTLALATQPITNPGSGICTSRGPVRDIPTDHLIEGKQVWLGTGVLKTTNTRPEAPNCSVRLGICTRSHATEGIIDVKIEIERDLVVSDILKEPTGFTAPGNVIVTGDGTARTVTLTGTVNGYYKGTPISELTTGWVSPAHPNDTDSYFLVFDGTYIADVPQFTWVTPSAANFYDLLIAFTFYDVVNAQRVYLRECHGPSMSWGTHEQQHDTTGTYLLEGGSFVDTDYVIGSTTPADRRPSISTTTLKDEDLPSILAALAKGGPYTQLFLTGGATIPNDGDTNFTLAAADIVPLLSNNPYWNEFDGTDWVQTLITNGNHMSVWAIGIPVAADSTSQGYRFSLLQGQGVTATQAGQQQLDPQEVNLGKLKGLTPESFIFGQILIEYIGGNWHIEEIIPITGSRTSQIKAGASGGLAVVEHDASLTGSGTVSDPLAVALAQALTSLSVGAQTSLINGLLQRIGGTMVLSSDTGTQVKAGTSIIQLLNDGAITLVTAASLISLLSGTTIDLEAVGAASLTSSGGSTTIGAAVALLLKNGVSTIATVDGSGLVINQGTLRSAIPSRSVFAAAATGALTDLGGNVDMNYASANVFTLPKQATAAIPVGGQIQISMLGAGQTSIAVEAGDLLVSANLMVDILAQYRSVVARKFDATTWILTGDLKF